LERFSPGAGPRNPSGGILVGNWEGEVTPLLDEIPLAELAAGFTQLGDVLMEPEIIIGALALFVSGGAMGAAGMLLSQWVVGRMSPPRRGRFHPMDARDIEELKADVADLAAGLQSVDARLDFTEELLGGALSGARPPESLPPQQLSRRREDVGFGADAASDGEGASSESEGASSDGASTSQ
jgi:hypothetical protein